MRKLLLTTVVFGLVVAGRANQARADVGLGFFLGEPTGLDLKVGLDPRSGLDLLFGINTFHDSHVFYTHATYLVTPLIAEGTSVSLPLRLGVGAELLGPSNDLSFGIRAPFEIGLRFKRSPLELYAEAALEFLFVGPADDFDVQGGGGLRVYF